MADDNNTLSRINELVEEERALRERLQKHEITATEEHERLKRLEVALDQCWDLLRQRRALRSSGGDPDSAAVRPEDQVEKYLG